jgi:diphthine-ammonia ligase
VGPGFLGRTLSAETVADLEAAGADPCGENGEYHTLVLNCPLFAQRLEVGFGDKRLHGEHWFLELLPVAGAAG